MDKTRYLGAAVPAKMIGAATARQLVRLRGGIA